MNERLRVLQSGTTYLLLMFGVVASLAITPDPFGFHSRRAFHVLRSTRAHLREVQNQLTAKLRDYRKDSVVESRLEELREMERAQVVRAIFAAGLRPLGSLSVDTEWGVGMAGSPRDPNPTLRDLVGFLRAPYLLEAVKNRDRIAERVFGRVQRALATGQIRSCFRPSRLSFVLARGDDAAAPTFGPALALIGSGCGTAIAEKIVLEPDDLKDVEYEDAIILLPSAPRDEILRLLPKAARAERIESVLETIPENFLNMRLNEAIARLGELMHTRRAAMFGVSFDGAAICLSFPLLTLALLLKLLLVVRGMRAPEISPLSDTWIGQRGWTGSAARLLLYVIIPIGIGVLALRAADLVLVEGWPPRAYMDGSVSALVGCACAVLVTAAAALAGMRMNREFRLLRSEPFR
jgi:hypothetical protein